MVQQDMREIALMVMLPSLGWGYSSLDFHGTTLA
jgi:hypothetical protein